MSAFTLLFSSPAPARRPLPAGPSSGTSPLCIRLQKRPYVPQISLQPVLGRTSQRPLVGLSFGTGSADAGGAADEGAVDEAAEPRGQSTMPDRFKNLVREVPAEPLKFKWLWFIAVILMIYSWRAVAWELTNWKKTLFSLVGFLAYLGKLVLAGIFLLIGDPITATIRFIETVLYSARSFYAGVVAFAPVKELTTIILLTSIILAISETTVEKSVNEQRHLLTIAGVLGYYVVVGTLPALLFWLLLFGLFCFSRYKQRKDNVSAALPAAAAAAAVGEPWLRFLTIASYAMLAISQLWKFPKRNTDEQSNTKLPLPLLWVGMAIGVHLAAKWVRYRHLTWMIA